MNARKKEWITTNVPDSEDWDNHDELKLKETIIQRQNQIKSMLKERSGQFESSIAELLSNMVEIADIILKNTCGVGSNFKLAECDLSLMSAENIKLFFDYVLAVLGYYFGQLIPQEREVVWQSVQKMIDDKKNCQFWIKKLSDCLDHESGNYSPVRAGRLLWEKVAGLFAVQDWENNTTARIYYQTALGQDLVYVIESSKDARWSGGV